MVAWCDELFTVGKLSLFLGLIYKTIANKKHGETGVGSNPGWCNYILWWVLKNPLWNFYLLWNQPIRDAKNGHVTVFIGRFQRKVKFFAEIFLIGSGPETFIKIS